MQGVGTAGRVGELAVPGVLRERFLLSASSRIGAVLVLTSRANELLVLNSRGARGSLSHIVLRGMGPSPPAVGPSPPAVELDTPAVPGPLMSPCLHGHPAGHGQTDRQQDGAVTPLDTGQGLRRCRGWCCSGEVLEVGELGWTGCGQVESVILLLTMKQSEISSLSLKFGI